MGTRRHSWEEKDEYENSRRIYARIISKRRCLLFPTRWISAFPTEGIQMFTTLQRKDPLAVYVLPRWGH